MEALYNLIGKPVVIDGCLVGYATQVAVTDSLGEATRMELELVTTEKTLDNLREYAVIMDVMGDA